MGSAFQLILRELAGRRLTTFVFGLIDAADYGAAQHRHRILWLGSRDGEDIRLTRAHSLRRPQAVDVKAWVTLGEASSAGLD